MNDKQWEKFFSLLREVVDQPLETWQEKAEEVRAKAGEHDGEGTLEEFVGWFQG